MPELPQLPLPQLPLPPELPQLPQPPALSSIAEMFAEPERIFEEQAAAMGIPVPIGPAKTLAQVLSNIETALSPTPPTPPTLPTPVQTIPTIPTGVSLGEPEKIEIGKPAPTPTRTKPKEKIEIIEV